MGSLISLFNISKEALDADQAALSATANNVANQNTVGYTREVVNFATQDLVTLSNTSNGAQNGSVYEGSRGDGVTASSPTSVRDRVLDQRTQQQTQVAYQSSAVQTALSEVENIFGLSETSASSSVTELGTAVNSFFSSLTQLATSPSDTATRQGVLSAASTLAGVFNSASSQITQIGQSLTTQALDIGNKANTLLTQIAALNLQISTASPNQDAGVLEDQRQEAISQLSQYIGLDQVTTSANGIELTTNTGAVLVSEGSSYPLAVQLINGSVSVVAGPTHTDVSSSLTGGTLGGTLQVLNSDLTPITNNLDTLAYAIASKVNAQNAQGLDANGNAGGALFDIGASSSGAAATIALAQTDPSLIAAAASGEGSSGNTNATALANLGTATDVAGQTASGFLASSLAQVGDAAATANNDNTVQQATLTQLTSQQNAYSGVSLDDEASNLTQYQRSYQAASQLFSIINSLLVSSINLGVVTSVS